MSIEADHLKALRNADFAVVDLSHDASGWTGHLRLGKEITRTDGFGDETLHIEVPFETIGVHQFAFDSDEQVDVDSVRWYIGTTQYHELWRTFVKLGSPTRTLGVSVLVSNNSDNLRNVGYHHDELRLLWGTENGLRVTHTIQVEDYVGPANSARPVQTSRRPFVDPTGFPSEISEVTA
jgi:tRNA G10  N-methylase Trm11